MKKKYRMKENIIHKQEKNNHYKLIAASKFGAKRLNVPILLEYEAMQTKP
jgi:hypothetical protein